MSEPIITVIVPTYKDQEGTNRCIEHLINQEIPKNEYEVIIVDNNEEPLLYKSVPDNFKIIHEPKPGSYAARNTGMKYAQGKYIAFTDSDCSPRQDWLKEGIGFLKNNKRVAGNIILESIPGEEVHSFASAYEKGFAFNQEDNASRGESVTANLMIHKDIICLIGPFDEKLYSGGDIEWNKRATDNGINIYYAENVVVSHPIRGSIKDITNKRIRVIGGQYKKMGLIQTLKFLIPPMKEILYLKKKMNMSLSEKCISWIVRYYLKIISFIYIILLKMNVVTPRRT